MLLPSYVLAYYSYYNWISIVDLTIISTPIGVMTPEAV